MFEFGKYKLFYGSVVDQMPLLIKEDRVPISSQGLMKLKLEALLSGDKELIDLYCNHPYTTGDTIALHPNGNIQIMLDCIYMRDLNEENMPSNGNFITEEMYSCLLGQEFYLLDIMTYTAHEMKEVQAANNLIWGFLSRDQKLLESYTKAIFAYNRRNFRHDKNMGLYIPLNQTDQPMFRTLTFGKLKYKSMAYCDLVTNPDATLIGVKQDMVD